MQIELSDILITSTVVGGIWALAVKYGFKRSENLLLSFVQSFCGVLFFISGIVKAADPLGTAYKMEQYFAEFESVFSETWMSFIAPIFPFFSNISIGFSVFMIVLELALAVMLLIGYKNKLTAWLFFGIVAFFTFLTGFTYLTGYVPEGVNFFAFGEWGDYVKTNMKVTDCGCFGDFVVLEPKTSFLKDVFLLLPAIIMLWGWKKMHTLWTPTTRNIIVGLTVVGSILSPVNILKQKEAEMDAATNAPVTYHLTNKATGEKLTFSYDDYIGGAYKEYPKTEWNVDSERGEPTVPETKISSFEFESVDGEEMTEVTSKEGYQFMIVAYKLYEDRVESSKLTMQDTTYRLDTIPSPAGDSIVRSIDKITPREVKKNTAIYDADYLAQWNGVTDVVNAGAKAGVGAFGLTSYIDPDKLEDFRHATQSAYPFYLADDILLKTIVRSNPGILLLKDGAIIDKWHYKKLPSFEEIKAKHIK